MPIKLAIVGSRTVDPSIEVIDAEVLKIASIVSLLHCSGIDGCGGRDEIPGSQNTAEQGSHDGGISSDPGSHGDQPGSQIVRIDYRALISEVVCGDARGGDYAGNRWAIHHGIPVHHEPILEEDIRRYGKYLGPRMRNRRVAERADVGIAFWDGKSGGTADFVCRMVARMKHVSVVPTRPTVRTRRGRRTYE